MPKRDLVLLALDNETIQQLMQRALRSVSYETAVASDRTLLNKIIQETVPALIMLGEQFDGLSGVKVAREVLERFPTMPILVYAEQESLVLYKEIVQAGLSGCLYPPLRNDDIIGSVERSLQRARNLGDWLRREVKRTTASLERRATLSESELKRYDFIFANIQDGVLIMDEERRIQLSNRTMEVAFDLPGKDVRGKLVSDVIDHPDFVLLLNRAHDHPLKYHEINFDDGRIYNAQYTPIGGFGSVVTMQEISYLKQFDRMKNEFVHTVSHDLRSPLTSVLGYTELIQRVGSLNEQQVDFLDRIRSSVESITSLVNELLDLSRLEAGFDTRRELVRIENILKFAMDTLEGQFQMNNLVVHLDIGKELPEIRGNPIRLRQLLDNLLSNAVKYSPKGATISVSLHAEDNQIIFCVADEGVGIPQSEQARIFEKFYRASNVPDEVGGSGLGLAIVKSIVDSHQGRIWVEAAKDKGSTFFVVLPAHDPDEIPITHELKS
jgi:two-component system, OmpR family, phosphate regulon sensor histidine kinase PhoR